MSDELAVEVLNLHAKRVKPIDGYPADHAYCVECGQVWPCATVRLVDHLGSQRR